MLGKPWHPQEYYLPACPLLTRINHLNSGKYFFEEEKTYLTHIDPLKVLLVSQVNFSSEINRVNTIEDDSKGGAAPEKGDEEEDAQVVLLDINVHVDGNHLQENDRLH